SAQPILPGRCAAAAKSGRNSPKRTRSGSTRLIAAASFEVPRRLSPVQRGVRRAAEQSGCVARRPSPEGNGELLISLLGKRHPAWFWPRLLTEPASDFEEEAEVLTIDAQVHAYERNHPGRPWVGTLTGPAEVTGTQMVAAMDAVGVDGAILVSPFS